MIKHLMQMEFIKLEFPFASICKHNASLNQNERTADNSNFQSIIHPKYHQQKKLPTPKKLSHEKYKMGNRSNAFSSTFQN